MILYFYEYTHGSDCYQFTHSFVTTCKYLYHILKRSLIVWTINNFFAQKYIHDISFTDVGQQNDEAGLVKFKRTPTTHC